MNGKADYYAIDGEDVVAEVQPWGLCSPRRQIADALERIGAIAAEERPLPGADPR